MAEDDVQQELPPGQVQINQLRSHGYSDDDITEWQADASQKFLDNGYKPEDVDAFFGTTKHDPQVMRDHVAQNLAARDSAEKPPTTDGGAKREPIDASVKPVEAEDFADSLAAGWATSVSGLIQYGENSPISMTDHANRMMKIGNMISQMAGDVPAMFAGGIGGMVVGAPVGGFIGSAVGPLGTLGGIATGTVVGGNAGAFGVPAGIRKMLMETYTKGHFKNSGDFMDSLAAASWEAIKAGTVGGLTGGAGKLAGGAAMTMGAKPLVAGTSTFAAELSTMATASAAMEKRLPNMDDFVNAGIVMGGVHGVMATVPKLMGIYAATGEHPAEIAAATEKDAVLKQEVVALNPDLPKIEVPSAEEQAKLGIMPFKPEEIDDMDFDHKALQDPEQVKKILGTQDHVEAYSAKLEDEILSAQARIDNVSEGKEPNPEDTQFIEEAQKTLKALESAHPDMPPLASEEAHQAVAVAQQVVDEQAHAAEGSPKPVEEPLASHEGLSDAQKEILNYVGAHEERADDSAMGALKRDLVKFWKDEGTSRAGNSFQSEFAGKVSDEFANFYVRHFDFTKGFSRMLDQLGSSPEAAKDPALLAAIHSEVMTKVKGWIEKGTRDFKTQKINGESHEQIMRDYHAQFPNDPQADGLRAYMIAKRVVEKAGQGMDIVINTGGNPDGENIDVETARQVVKEGQGKYEPFNQRRIEYRNRVLQYAHDAGFWTPEQFQAMKDQNQSYASFHRVQELDPLFGNKVRGGSKGVFRMRGVGNLIVDPLVSDIKDTIMIVKMAEENKVKQAAVATLATGDDSAFLRKVDNNMKLVKVSAEEMSPHLEEQQIEHDPETLEALTVFRSEKARIGDTRMEVHIDGERHVYEGDKDTIEILDRLKGIPSSSGMFSNLLKTAAAGIRAGTINAWAFLTKHSVRNQILGATNSETSQGMNQYLPVLTPLMHAPDMFPGTEGHGRWNDFLNDGGAQSSYMAYDDQWVQSKIFAVEKKAPFLNRAWNLVTSPEQIANLAQRAAHISHAAILKNDNLIRYAEYSRALDQGSSRTEAAGMARRILPDVQTTGLQHSFWLTQTAFLGIHVKGLARAAEAVGDQIETSRAALEQGNIPEALKGPMARSVALITLPSVLLAAANYGNQRIDRLLPWQKYGYWNVPMTDWQPATQEEAAAMPHDDLKRQMPDGSWQIDNGTTWRMQMPFTHGVFFGGIVQAAFDQWGKKDPDAMHEWAKNVGESTVAIPIPNFAQPAIAQTTNYNAFTGQPIIPDNKIQLAPELQYEPYTTETAKTIGKLIGATWAGSLGPEHQKLASPMIVEEYVRDWSGPIGMSALKVADAAFFKSKTGPVPTPEWADIPAIGAFAWRNDTFKTDQLDKFTKDYQLASSNKKSFRELVKQGQPDAAMDFADRHEQDMNKLGGIYKAISNLKQTVQAVTANTEIDSKQKRQLVERMYYQADEMAKMGNKMMDQLRKTMKDDNKPDTTDEGEE